MGALILILVGLFFYFIPAIVGYPKKNAGAIFLLNLFLGWTLIGWVAALVWAVTKDSESQVVINNSNNNPLDQIKQLRQLYSDGSITEREYEAQKKKILGE